VSVEDRIADRRQRGQTRAATAVLIICGSSYFSMLAGVLRSILVMRMLGPTAQGVRRTVDLVTKYLFNAHLGILHGASKQLPLYLGEHDARRVQEVEDVGITWIIGLTFLASAGMLAWGLTNPTGHRTTQIAIIIGAGWLLVQQTYTVYRTILRAWGHFPLLGIVAGVDTLATFAFTLLGAWKYGVLGAMVGTLLAWCISLLAFGLYSPLRIRPRFDIRIGLELARTGLPIAAVIFADTLLRTVDGAITVRYYEATRFGLYSLAMQMAAYLFAIPEAAGFVIWPRIIEAFGAARGDLQRLRRQVILPTLVSATFMPVLAGLTYILLPPVVNRILPQFARATTAAQVLSMASVFLALPMATNSLLIALNREWVVVVTKLSGAAVSAAGCWWFVTHQAGLTHLAAAASAGYAVAGLVSVIIVVPQYEQGITGTIKSLAGILTPFIYSCVALFASYEIAAFVVQPGNASWHWAIVRGVVFALLIVPVLLFGNQQTGLVGELRSILVPSPPPPPEVPDDE
jgi:O-antigen/teichoic acid export membrane protein